MGDSSDAVNGEPGTARIGKTMARRIHPGTRAVKRFVHDLHTKPGLLNFRARNFEK
jgi:hypothetical protein